MLFPTLVDLVKVTGNRYKLVNVVARRARQIADYSEQEDIQLTDKPVKLAILELYDKLQDSEKEAEERLMAQDGSIGTGSELPSGPRG